MTFYNFEEMARQVRENEIETIDIHFPKTLSWHTYYPNGYDKYTVNHGNYQRYISGADNGTIAIGWDKNVYSYKIRYWVLGADGTFSWVSFGSYVNKKNQYGNFAWEKDYNTQTKCKLDFRPTTCVQTTDDHFWMGSEDGHIYFLDKFTNSNIGEPSRILEAHTAAVTDLILMGDKTHFVSSSLDGTIKIWDHATFNKKDYVASLSVGNIAITALAVLPNGKIASGDAEGWIRVWDLTSGKCILSMHAGNAISRQCLKALPNGNLVSGSQDGTIKVWNPENWNDEEKAGESCCLHTLKLDDPVSQLYLKSDGYLVVGGGNNLYMVDPDSGYSLNSCYIDSPGERVTKIPLAGKAGPMLEWGPESCRYNNKIFVSHANAKTMDEFMFEVRSDIYASDPVLHELRENRSVKLIRISGIGGLEETKNFINARLNYLLDKRKDNLVIEIDLTQEQLDVIFKELPHISEEKRKCFVPIIAPEISSQKTLRLLREQKATHEQEITLLQEEIQKLKQQADLDRQQKIALEKELRLTKDESQIALCDQEKKAQALMEDQQALIEVQTKRLTDNQLQIEFLSHEVEVLKEENTDLEDALNRRMDMLALEMTESESKSEKLAIKSGQSTDKKLSTLVAESNGQMTEVLFNALTSLQRAHELKHLNLIAFVDDINIASIKDQLERSGVIFSVHELIERMKNINSTASFDEVRLLVQAADQVIKDLNSGFIPVKMDLDEKDLLENKMQTLIKSFFENPQEEKIEGILKEALQAAIQDMSEKKKQRFSSIDFSEQHLIDHIRSNKNKKLTQLAEKLIEPITDWIIENYETYFMEDIQRELSQLKSSIVKQEIENIVVVRNKLAKSFYQDNFFNVSSEVSAQSSSPSATLGVR
ncbi:MAG: hypothetical protein SFW66_03945 [Gammaproteobacteria bacterium]|nr:hypothetical protein [Gammaproteobacteria bacterium]